MKTVGFEIGNKLKGVMGGDETMEEVMKIAEPTPKMIPVDVLDKIRAEIIELRSRQNVGVLECLDIIDKYKAESEK